MIYAGGAIDSGIRLASLKKEMSDLDVEKERQELRFLLLGYYLDLYKIRNQINTTSRPFSKAKGKYGGREAKSGRRK